MSSHRNRHHLQIQSGSEFLLSTSGSFKRFDTIDKDDYNRSQQTQLLLINGGGHMSIAGSSSSTIVEATTPMWNLPLADTGIPPQPLRPAPAPAPNPASAAAATPGSAGPASKTVSFSFSQVNEVVSVASVTSLGDQERRSCLRLNGGGTAGVAVLPQPLEAPPPPRLTTSASVNLSGTAIPRPTAKRQVSLQQGINGGQQVATSAPPSAPEPALAPAPEEIERRTPALKRRNSSTNPFLCESTEQMPSPSPNPETISSADSKQPALVPAPSLESSSHNQHNGNPFVESQSLSSRLLKLHNTTNPFTGLSQRVKGPHLLQKTISEDYLFRKLGVANPMANGHHNGNGHGNGNGNGNGTWSFGRSLLRQDSTLSLGMGLGRRNSSQTSLDSGSGSVSGSLEGINLERAISCDSVTSDSTLFLDQLDQPYTQITGYLCVGLNYDK